MIIIDGHQDIAFNALGFNRDYRRSAHAKRMNEAGGDIPRSVGTATIGLPEALLGRVGIVFATLFVEPDSNQALSPAQLRYTTPAEAHRLAQRQLDYYHKLADDSDLIRLIRTQTELDAVLATWTDDTDIMQHKQGLVILMENADPIREPKEFEAWYERGVRIVGPAWRATRYCGGTGQPGGLTKLGHELLDVMASFNAILDVSHMAEEAFFEALDRYEGAIIASHSNPRRFKDSDRHLSDTMIRRLIERDGVIGVVLFNGFLSQTWTRTDRKSDVPFATILNVIDHICQVAGDAQHVSIGSDFDGGFGAESTPEGIDTVTDLWLLGDALAERGYSAADVEAILSGNLLRKLRQTLPR